MMQSAEASFDQHSLLFEFKGCREVFHENNRLRTENKGARAFFVRNTPTQFRNARNEFRIRYRWLIVVRIAPRHYGSLPDGFSTFTSANRLILRTLQSDFEAVLVTTAKVCCSKTPIPPQ